MKTQVWIWVFTLSSFLFFSQNSQSQTQTFSPKEIQQIEKLLQDLYDFYFSCVEYDLSPNEESNPGSHFQNAITQLRMILNDQNLSLSTFVKNQPSDALGFIRFFLTDARDLGEDHFPFQQDNCHQKLKILETDFQPIKHLQGLQRLEGPQNRILFEEKSFPQKFLFFGLAIVLAVSLVVIACKFAIVGAAAALLLLVAQNIGVPLSSSSSSFPKLLSLLNSTMMDSCKPNCSSPSSFSKESLNVDFQLTKNGYFGWVSFQKKSSAPKIHVWVENNFVTARLVQSPTQTKICQSEIRQKGKWYFPTPPVCWTYFKKG